MAISVNIPVSYLVHGYLPLRQQPRSYLYAEFMALEIAEVTSGEAPIAVEWSPPQTHGTSMSLSSYSHDAVESFDASGCQHTVYYEGRHWVRLLERHANPRSHMPGAALNTHDTVARIERGDLAKIFGFSERTQSQKTPKVVDGDPRDQFQSVSRNLRGRAMEAFERLQLLSVDGNLYMACSQPCYALVTGWVHGEQGNILRVPFVDVWSDRSPRNLYWDRINYVPLSATDIVSDVIDALPSSVSRIVEVPRIHIPDTLSAEEDLKLLADHYVHEFMAKSIYIHPIPFAPIQGYFDQAMIEDKAAFLAEREQQWSSAGADLKLPINYLYKALEILDERTIGIIPAEPQVQTP